MRIYVENNKGGSRAAAASKMERFVIIVNGWKQVPKLIRFCSFLLKSIHSLLKNDLFTEGPCISSSILSNIMFLYTPQQIMFLNMEVLSIGKI